MDAAAVFKALSNGLKAQNRPPCRYLLQATTSLEGKALAGTQCLMLVQAHHEGLRDAYARLKVLTEREQPALIGITISDAPSSRSARYHYTKLAAAAQRFLGLHVASYGALPPSPPPWAMAGNQAMLQEDAIHHIARMIIQDWQDYQQTLNEERTPT